MARLLVDESLPRAASRLLGELGHDVVDARDVGLRGRPDSEVVTRALNEARVIVSADTDFANPVAFPPGSHVGVVVSRVPDEWGSARRAERLADGLEDVGEEALAGAIVVVEAARCRIYTPPEDDAT